MKDLLLYPIKKKKLWLLPLYLLLFLFSLVSVNATIDWDNDVYLLYPLWEYETNATGILDLGPNGYNGTIQGNAAYNSGKTAFTFDGTDDGVTTSNNAVSVPYTVSFWVNASTGDNSQTFWSGVSNFDGVGYTTGYGIYIAGPNGAATDSLSLAKDIRGAWQHITVVYPDSTWTNAKLYINGTEQTVVQSGDGYWNPECATYNSPNNYYAFGWCQRLARDTTGEMSDTIIFNRSLTTTEINNLYLEGQNYNPYVSTPTITSNLTTYYNTSNITIQLNTTTNTNMSYVLNSGNETTICNECNNSVLNLTSLSEGNYNITWISTDSNGQVNSTETFTIDTTNPTINNNILAEYNEYTISGFNSSCSDTNLDYCNISLNSQNVLLNTTSFTFTLNGNITYTITAQDLAGNSITENGTILVNPYQYIRFNDTATSTYIQNYSVITTNGTYNVIGEYLNISLYDLGIGTHELQFYKSGYINETFNITFNTTSDLNVSYDVDRVTLTIQTYDIDTSTQIYFNVTILNSSTSQIYLNQFNFSQIWEDIPTGDIELQISSNGYTDIIYYQTINPYTSINIDAYMFSENVSDVVTFTVQDKSTASALEGVLIELQELINGTYTTLSQKYTGSSGQAFFYLDITDSYKVIFSKDGYVSATATTIPGTTSYTVKLETSISAYEYIDSLSYSIHPTNTLLEENTSYSFSGFLSSTGITATYFNIYWDNGTSIYSSSSTNPTGATFLNSYTLPSNINNSYIYVNLSWIKDGTLQQVIKQYDIISYNNASFMDALKLYGENDSEDAKLLKWFIIMIVAVIIMVMGSIQGIQTLNLLIIPFFAFLSVIGWLGWTYSAVLIMISLILYLGGKR